MRTLPLAVLALALLTLAPAHAQPAPAPVTDRPEAVAAQFLAALRAPGTAAEALAVPTPGEGGADQDNGLRAALGFIPMFGLAGPITVIAAGDQVEAQAPLPPLRLAVAVSRGAWKVDTARTYTLLPAGLRKLVEGQNGPARPGEELGASEWRLSWLALAAFLYLGDHAGRLPDADKWMDELLPYCKGNDAFKDPGAPRLDYGYAMNRAVSGLGWESLAHPDQVALFFTSDLGTRNASGGPESVAFRFGPSALYAGADGGVGRWDRDLGQGRDLRPAVQEPTLQPAGPPTDDQALAVAQQYEELVHQVFDEPGHQDLKVLEAAVVTVPLADVVVESPLMLGTIFPAFALMWKQPGPAEFRPTGAPGRGEVVYQMQPLRLALVMVEGAWKVDMAGTYARLPAPFRALIDQDLARMKAAGENQTRCLRNVVQLAGAALLYAQEHDGRLPDADKWTDELKPYLPDQAVFTCPAAPQLEGGYAMNQALSGVKLDTLANPAEAILFFDSDLGKRNAAAVPARASLRDRGGANCSFADGHAKWMQSQDLRPVGPGGPTRAPLPPHPAAPGAGGPAPPG